MLSLINLSIPEDVRRDVRRHRHKRMNIPKAGLRLGGMGIDDEDVANAPGYHVTRNQEHCQKNLGTLQSSTSTSVKETVSSATNKKDYLSCL